MASFSKDTETNDFILLSHSTGNCAALTSECDNTRKVRDMEGKAKSVELFITYIIYILFIRGYLWP